MFFSKRSALAAGLTLMAASLYASAAMAQGYSPTSNRNAAFEAAPDNFPRTANSVAMVSATPNGSFETNGGVNTNQVPSWTVVDQVGGSGSWLVQTGAVSPLSAAAVNAPTTGNFALMTDQTGPGSHVLYQDVQVPPQGGTLTFNLFIRNAGGAFASPNTLDYAVAPNQQFRIDLMNPAAGAFDAGTGVVQNLYQTAPGDPLTAGYATVTRAIQGNGNTRTLRLRFAEVDNQGFLNIGIDDVNFVAGFVSTTGVPALDWRGLMLMATLLAMVAALFAGRHANQSR